MRPARDFDHAPLVAIWEVTRACDLRCLHCRASAMPSRDPRELSTAEAFDFAATANVFAEDPACAYVPPQGQTQRRTRAWRRVTTGGSRPCIASSTCD